jgi:hypothetical protein
MATSLAFGVAFAALISLFLVPASYLILDDLNFRKRRPKLAPVEREKAVDRARRIA